MRNNKTFYLAFSVICMVLNLVLGSLVSWLGIPLIFLDTMGTMVAAVALGPFWGALVGLATNVLLGVLTNPVDIPFALVNMTIGLVTGLIARRFGYSFRVALTTGLILSVVAPLIGTPIVVWLYGGLTGSATDFFTGWLLASGQKIFAAAFLPRIAGNLVDKVASALFAWAILNRMPAEIRQRFPGSEA